MSDFRQRTKINKVIVDVTGSSPVEIIPAQAGYAIGLVDIIMSNMENAPAAIQLYEETSELIPLIGLTASGVFEWSSPGGGQYELIAGSGLNGSVITSSDTVQVAAFYVLHVESTPITKSAARAATLTPTTVRTPNFFGGQQKT